MLHKTLLTVVAIILTCIPSAVSAHSPIDKAQAGDLAYLTDEANLIFVGKVINIAYRNAEGADQGVIPYTIVTYHIDQVLRGKAPGNQITLRLIGGPDGRGNFLTVSGVPIIQTGDQDILFVRNTDDTSCPLVYCEGGRYRILNEQVFNTHGSPVLMINKYNIISRGKSPKEFQTIRFPSPKFDELLKNPEVVKQLKVQRISVEKARQDYEVNAPKYVEFTNETSKSKEMHDATEGGLPANEKDRLSAANALALSKFIDAVQNLTALSKRVPSDVRSVDPTAKIIAPKTTLTKPQKLDRATIQDRPIAAEKAEYEAFKKNGFDPVLKK